MTAYCCVWYRPDTDYAYVEPVCTVPAHRGKGLAAALLTEALSRARALGAREAYVISDLLFYEKLGFEKVRHYIFPKVILFGKVNCTRKGACVRQAPFLVRLTP